MLENKRFIAFAAGTTAFGLSVFSACAESSDSNIDTILSPNIPSPTQIITEFNPNAFSEINTDEISSAPAGGFGGMFPGALEGNPNPPKIPSALVTETPQSLIQTAIPTQTYFAPEGTPFCNFSRWQEGDIPTSLDLNGAVVHSFEQIEKVTPIPEDELEENDSPYVVPLSGIATLERPNYKNLIYVWGHSADVATLERREFAEIENMNIGDFIFVTNQNGIRFCFAITDFILTGLSGEEGGVLLRDYDEPTLMIQTSARTGNGTWIMSPDIVNKREATITDNLNQYLVVLLKARQL